MAIEDDPPPSVPEWVVTYGDMMSLLLTFFIMLVSLSEVRANKKYRAVLESLQHTLGYRAGPIVPPGEYYPLNSMVQSNPVLGSFTDKKKGRGGVKVPQSSLGEDLRVHLPRQGDAVPAGDFIDFEPFSVELDDDARRLLEVISRKLAGKPNKIEVCGHTSSRALPVDSPYPNLMSLAYGRGRQIYDALIKLGIEPERMRVVACADHQPLPASHDAHQLHEDRVEVLILNTYQQDFVGPRDEQRTR